MAAAAPLRHWFIPATDDRPAVLLDFNAAEHEVRAFVFEEEPGELSDENACAIDESDLEEHYVVAHAKFIEPWAIAGHDVEEEDAPPVLEEIEVEQEQHRRMGLGTAMIQFALQHNPQYRFPSEAFGHDSDEIAVTPEGHALIQRCVQRGIIRPNQLFHPHSSQEDGGEEEEEEEDKDAGVFVE